MQCSVAAMVTKPVSSIGNGYVTITATETGLVTVTVRRKLLCDGEAPAQSPRTDLGSGVVRESVLLLRKLFMVVIYVVFH